MSTTIAEKVKKLIISKNMQPGDKLPSEVDLMDIFNVSRTTVREAMKILRAENIVEIQQGRGTFISKSPGIKDDPLGLSFSNPNTILKNLLEARLVIEPAMILLAVQNLTEDDISELEIVINKMQELNTHSKYSADLDLEFHTLIAKATKNEVLYRVLPIINESIYKGYGSTENNPDSFEKAMESHIRIFNALKNRDAMTARYELEKHIRQTIEDIN